MFDFQYYNAITTAKPEGFTSLSGFINDVKTCKYKGIPKTELPYCTPCAVFSYRNYENLTRFTGLMAVDMDHVENAAETRNWLFDTYQETLTAFISPSGKGVRALLRIPVVTTIDQFKSLFWGLYAELKSDASMQRPTQPFFYSNDPGILSRNIEDCPQWNINGEKQQPVYDPLPQVKDVRYTSGDMNRIKGIFRSMVQRIKPNEPRHPQIIQMSNYMGGFIKAGYLSSFEAQSILWELINTNSWIRQGSLEQYKKDITDGINNGLKSRDPITLKPCNTFK